MKGLSLFDTAFLAGGITDWAARVVINGGAMPSAPTIAAMEVFRLGVIAAGLSSKIHSLCVFVPDSLIAATTPLFVGIGSDPWTNNNFVGGDLTVEGLLGDGATKYLDTGVQAKSGQAINAGTGNCGITAMVSRSNANAQTIISGAQDSLVSSDPALLLLVSGYSLGAGLIATAFTAAGFSGASTASGNDWIRTGYISGNQVGGTSSVYVANDYQSHVLLASIATATSPTVTNNTIYAFATSLAGAAASFSGQRASVMAIHDGFTAGESLSFYNLITTLRTSLGGGLGNPVDDWSNRVVVNGGAAPAAGTVSAIKTFCSSLLSDGIYDKMAVVNVVAPDSLTAARVPLICQAGSLIWTNVNFVGGDLNTSGITGNGTNKYFNTGIIPRNCYKWSEGSAGLSLMVSVVPAPGTPIELGSLEGVGTGTLLYNQTTGAGVYLWGYATGTDTISAALPSTAWPGFITANRTATNAMALYRASTANAFASIASTAGAKTINLSANTIELYTSAYNSAGSAAGWSDRTHAFIGFHQGLNSTEAEALYDSVATLRTALGGGNP